jgi:hypothetical protein
MKTATRGWLGLLAGLAAAAISAAAPANATTTRPAASFWGCRVPPGYTYDRVVNELNVCNPSGFAYSYHVVSPANGIWACGVPAGYTYDRVVNELNVCNPSGFAYSYRLRR